MTVPVAPVTLYKRPARSEDEYVRWIKVRPIKTLIKHYREHDNELYILRRRAISQLHSPATTKEKRRRTVHSIEYHREMLSDCQGEVVMYVTNFLLKQTKDGQADAGALLKRSWHEESDEELDEMLQGWVEKVCEVEDKMAAKTKKRGEKILGDYVYHQLRKREIDIEAEYEKRKTIENEVAKYFHPRA